MRLRFTNILREILLATVGLCLVFIFLALSQMLPYKYSPIYYLNNVLFIDKLPENPLLVKSVFGKVGIHYRDDVIKSGVIFFGEFHDKNDKTATGKFVPVGEYVDIKTFREVPEDDTSVSSYYKDKNYSYVIHDVSDGIYLHIYTE